MAFCGKCGNQLEEGAKFCPKCGQAIDNGFSVPHQNENLSQLNNDKQEEKGLNIWTKILILALWPIGLILGFIYKNKMMTLKAKEAFLFCMIGLGAGIGIYLSHNINGCSSNTQRIEKTAKNLMIEQFKKDDLTLHFKNFTLVHKSGNEYTGVADCYVDGENIQYSLKAFSDGRSVQIEWTPINIGIEESETE